MFAQITSLRLGFLRWGNVHGAQSLLRSCNLTIPADRFIGNTTTLGHGHVKLDHFHGSYPMTLASSIAPLAVTVNGLLATVNLQCHPIA